MQKHNSSVYNGNDTNSNFKGINDDNDTLKNCSTAKFQRIHKITSSVRKIFMVVCEKAGIIISGNYAEA